MMKGRQKILYRWIVLGCAALVIPLLCAIINFALNMKLMSRNVEQISDFMLGNIQHTIDAKLSSIRDTANHYLLDEHFNMYALGVDNSRTFMKNVQDCYQVLEVASRADTELEIMIYIPEKQYIIDSATANDVSHIYRSLAMNQKISLSQEEWCEALRMTQNSTYDISDIYTYGNCGKESLVYKSSLLYSNQNTAGSLFVSVPSEFISEAMSTDTNSNSTILIMDGTHNIIGQYGVELNLEGVELTFQGDGGTVRFEANGERYVGKYTSSEINDWQYMFCMPEKLFMNEVFENRNMNLLVIVAGGFLGVLAVVLLQRRNYRPLQRLIDILPEKEEGITLDEFKQIEYNLHRMYSENRSMQNSIESRREYDREQCFLAALKGRKNFFSKINMEELLGEQFEQKHFCLVTFCAAREASEYRMETADDELIGFVLENIIGDILGEKYGYMKAIADDTIVYLFYMEKGKAYERWDEFIFEKLEWLTEFFQNRLSIELTITISELFDNFDSVESMYISLQEANEQRYYTKPYGVMRADMVRQVDYSINGRLAYYNKRMKELITRADFEGVQELSNTFFSELGKSESSLNVIVYKVLAVVNSVMAAAQAMVLQELIANDEVEDVLIRLRQSETLDVVKDNYLKFFRLLCRVVDEENKDSGQLSGKIKKYVMENYMDSNMNISMIADAIGMTPRYMSKIFWEQTGESLLSYINNVRIEQAKILLKTTSRTVDEIAEETGFGNSRTFRRNFQKALGITASNYRNLQDTREDIKYTE